MSSFEYVVTPRGRISAGKSVGAGNLKAAHEILPGTTVRGAMAAAWWRDRRPSFTSDDEAQAALDSLFERALIFRQAIPVSTGAASEPPTLRGHSEVRCKYPEDAACSVWADQAIARLHDPTREPQRNCGCGGAIETGKGWEVGHIPTVVRTSTRLDEHGRALDHSLFARQSIEPEVTFHGAILIRPGHSLEDSDAEWLAAPIRVRIGGRRTVLGAATIAIASQDAASIEPRRADARAVIRLASPAIIVDEYGAPAFDIGGELRRILDEPELAIEHSWQRSTPITGWHMPSRLPRPLEWAIDAGSTFVVTGLPGAKWKALAYGIGLRTGEGYGAVLVFDHVDDHAESSSSQGACSDRGTKAGQNEGKDTAETAQESEPGVSLASRFIASLPQNVRLNAMKATRTHLRSFRKMSAAHCESSRMQKVRPVLAYPWAQTLTAESRTMLEELISRETDLAGAEAELSRAIRIEEGS